jgi:hypothetical protein
MSALIPEDVESFLYELGNCQEHSLGAFERFAKTTAALLWEKYVILEDPTIQVPPPCWYRFSKSPPGRFDS